MTDALIKKNIKRYATDYNLTPELAVDTLCNMYQSDTNTDKLRRCEFALRKLNYLWDLNIPEEVAAIIKNDPNLYGVDKGVIDMSVDADDDIALVAKEWTSEVARASVSRIRAFYEKANPQNVNRCIALLPLTNDTSYFDKMEDF